jgi:hypothetical protein
MTWSDHIDDINKRSNKPLDIISKMGHILPRLCIEKIYKSFVRSRFDFSDVIGDNCSNIDSTKIASILRGESIILTGAIRVAKHNTLLKEACVEPLKTGRNYTDCHIYLRYRKKLTPDYLVNIRPLSCHTTQKYDLTITVDSYKR